MPVPTTIYLSPSSTGTSGSSSPISTNHNDSSSSLRKRSSHSSSKQRRNSLSNKVVLKSPRATASSLLQKLNVFHRRQNKHSPNNHDDQLLDDWILQGLDKFMEDCKPPLDEEDESSRQEDNEDDMYSDFMSELSEDIDTGDDLADDAESFKQLLLMHHMESSNRKLVA